MRNARGMEGHDSELQLGLGAAQAFYREMDQVLSTREYLLRGRHLSDKSFPL